MNFPNMMSVRSILFFLLVSGDVSFGGFLDVDMKSCPKRDGVFPKIGSYCKSYYRCSGWVPLELTCPEDQLFNPIEGWCDWVDLFTCLDKPKRKECPRESGLFLKSGTQCRSYYACCGGEPTEMTCPRGTLFDPSAEKCEWEELYTCIEERNKNECPKENGRFLKLGTDCKLYYDCREGNPTVRECPENQIFDASQERCEWMELHECDESYPDTISSTFNPHLRSSTKVIPYTTSTTRPDYKTSRYPEVSSLRTTFDPYTESTTEDNQSSSISTGSPEYRTSRYPEVSSLRTTFDPSTEPSRDDVRSSSISTGSPDYRTSRYPEVSSLGTTFFPYTESTRDDVRSSSISTGSPGYRTSRYPEVSSLGTTIDPYPKSTVENVRSSKISTTTIDHRTSRYPDSSSFQTTIIPYKKSSIGEFSTATSKTTIEPYDPTSSYKTIQPNTKSTARVIEETRQPVDIWCPEPSGYFPHPTDKHKFIGCVNSVPSVMDCPSNLVYNHKKRRCDYK